MLSSDEIELRPSVQHLPASYKKVIELAGRPGGVRARDLEAAGLYATYAKRLVSQGHLIKVGRGTYAARVSPAVSREHAGLISAAQAAPRGILCLTTALRFHRLVKRDAGNLWIALGTNDRRPVRLKGRARFVHVAPACLAEGVEIRRLDGVEVRMFSAAKSVADAFKFRRRVGIDVAVEALQNFQRLYGRRARELERAASVCRVERVMRPYMDALSVKAGRLAR